MPLPIITVAQMREWEKATWASGQTELAVMRLAGQAVARRAEQLTRPRDLILILAGKGHNGDDAAFAAEQINNRQIHLSRVSDPEAAITEIAPLLDRSPALIVDGLFGIGLNRPLASNWLKLIQHLNQAQFPILSVDVPSGVNADTGEPLEDAIRASHTLTFGAVKIGLISSTCWPFVGRLEVAPEIGLIPYPFTTELRWTVPEDFPTFPSPRPVAGHKGTFGHLVIIAGSMGYHGAAVLAAKGAQRAQPGRVTLFTPENVYLPIASQLQSTMVHPWPAHFSLPDSCTALAVGPGLAANDLPAQLKPSIAKLWRDTRLPMLVDASALDWIPQGPVPPSVPRVITPHPGEASRLLQTSVPGVLSDRVKSLRNLSGKYGDCLVILKSHQTLIGSAKEELFVNCSGNAHLAQGGSGDLLTGFAAGLLAQPQLNQHPQDLLRYAVWQHGAAADLLSSSRSGWTIENLAETLGAVRTRART